MKIVVTGAKGFIGSRLAAALRGVGHEVCGLDVGDDLASLDDLAPVDAFYHLAWTGSRGPARADCALQIENVKMSLDYYARACALGVRRFVCAGTIGELMAESPECSGIKSQNFVYVTAKGFLRRVQFRARRAHGQNRRSTGEKSPEGVPVRDRCGKNGRECTVRGQASSA